MENNLIKTYSFCDDKQGNIEVNFHVDEPGNCKLIIEEKHLERMQIFSELGKKLSKGEI